MLHTTFRKLQEAGACAEGYKKLAAFLGGVRAYGGNTPIPLDKILDSNGLEDALWSLMCTIEINPEYDKHGRNLTRIKELLGKGFSEDEAYEREEEESDARFISLNIPENFIIEFACRCAEHVLFNYEVLYPDDSR